MGMSLFFSNVIKVSIVSCKYRSEKKLQENVVVILKLHLTPGELKTLKQHQQK